MVKFLLAIVTRNGEIHYDPLSDSHDRLIEINGLCEATAAEDFVRITFAPTYEGPAYDDPQRYRLHINEEEPPAWFDEQMARTLIDRLRAIVAGHIITRHTPCLRGGSWIIKGDVRINRISLARIIHAGDAMIERAECSQIRHAGTARVAVLSMSQVFWGERAHIWRSVQSDIVYAGRAAVSDARCTSIFAAGQATFGKLFRCDILSAEQCMVLRAEQTSIEHAGRAEIMQARRCVISHRESARIHEAIECMGDFKPVCGSEAQEHDGRATASPSGDQKVEA